MKLHRYPTEKLILKYGESIEQDLQRLAHDPLFNAPDMAAVYNVTRAMVIRWANRCFYMTTYEQQRINKVRAMREALRSYRDVVASLGLPRRLMKKWYYMGLTTRQLAILFSCGDEAVENSIHFNLDF